MKTYLALFGVLLMALTAGCGKKRPAQSTTDASLSRQRDDLPPQLGHATVGWNKHRLPLEKVATVLPAGADVYAAVSLGPLITVVSAIYATPIVGASLDLKKLLGEIKEVCLGMLGVDCTAARWAAGFASLRDRAFGLVIAGVPGTFRPDKRRIDTIAGQTAYRMANGLYLIHRGQQALLGNRKGLAQLLQIGKSGAKTLAQTANAPCSRCSPATTRAVWPGSALISIGYHCPRLSSSIGPPSAWGQTKSCASWRTAIPACYNVSRRWRSAT